MRSVPDDSQRRCGDSANETMEGEEEAQETDCPNDGLEGKLRVKDQTETDGSTAEEQDEFIFSDDYKDFMKYCDGVKPTEE